MTAKNTKWRRSHILFFLADLTERPDLAMPCMEKVVAPTLLIVGEGDKKALQLNRLALVHLVVEKDLAVVSGASHLFEEPGTLDKAANLATNWLVRHFG